ncbi:MAG TPA: hypothetical protein VFB54_02645 [Burkholderiales bacterium]|nr:hypothetical protein [Burkholderiales bacterium]
MAARTIVHCLALIALCAPTLYLPLPALAQGAGATPAAIDPQPLPPRRYVQIAPGWLVARVFTSERSAAGAVEIADVLVGPRQRAVPLPMHAGGLFEVHAGSAVLEINGKKQKLTQGQIVAIAPGDRIAVDNRAQPRPLVVRLIRFGDVGGLP